MNAITPTEPAPMTLRELGEAIAGLDSLPPVERAQRAGELFTVAHHMLPRARYAALYEATRGYGARLRVARELGVTPASITYAIDQHRKA